MAAPRRSLIEALRQLLGHGHGHGVAAIANLAGTAVFALAVGGTLR